MYALVDGNNFYVSCERVFRPSLVGLPVVVLSNNDGYSIVRSNETKALGIAMGAPWFKIQHMVESDGLAALSALSANFALYGDLSDRMTSLAAGLEPRQKSFIDRTGERGNLVERCHKVRSRILQWVAIPCGIGIGHTKTPQALSPRQNLLHLIEQHFFASAPRAQVQTNALVASCRYCLANLRLKPSGSVRSFKHSAWGKSKN